MVDGAGAEMLQHRRHQHGEQQRQPRGRVAGQLAREPGDTGQEYQQERRRPEDGRHPLGERLRQHHRAGPDQHRERQVDQPRPVHCHPVRRVQPVLHGIEPALAGEQVADLDEAHGVVGRQAFVSAQARYQVASYRRRPNDEKQRPDVGPLRWGAVQIGR